MDEIKKIEEWIVNYLEKPNENFGGMPVCPFVKKERITEKLLIDVWKPEEKSFLQLLEKLDKSEKYRMVIPKFNCGVLNTPDLYHGVTLLHPEAPYRTTIQIFAT